MGNDIDAAFLPRGMGDEQAAQVDAIRTAATTLKRTIEAWGPSRERALALTSLEVTVFWAVKGVALSGGVLGSGT